MNATVFKFARPLSLIVLDLATTKSRVRSLYARTELSDTEERECSLLEDRRSALEDEFAEQFRMLTGVEWTMAERVMS